MEKTFADAKTLAYEGDFQSAFDILNDTDRSADATCLYISLCRVLKKEELARTELTALLARNPDHPRANHLFAIGILDGDDLGRERLEQAEAFLAKAERGYDETSKDDLSELYTDWGNLHHERGDTLKAILFWRRALQLSDNNDVAAKNLEQFDDVNFSKATTVNEMIGMAKHPAQVLAHLIRQQNFKTPEEAQDFANEILSLWNKTPRG